MRMKTIRIPILSNYLDYTIDNPRFNFRPQFFSFIKPGLSLLFTLQSYGGADRLQGPGTATIWRNIFGTPSTNLRFGLS